MTNIHTLPAINLMRNLAVELFGIDQTLSYQQAFVYIRQLAIHLRGAMQTKSSVRKRKKKKEKDKIK